MSESTSSQPIDPQISEPDAGERSIVAQAEVHEGVEVGSSTDPEQLPADAEQLPAKADSAAPLDPMKLSPRQVMALKCLINGVSMSDAALAAHVGRSTLYRWLTHHAAFRAAYNRWKASAHLSAQTRLIALQDLAVEVMEEKLQTKRDGRLAALLLTKLGALSASPPGATEPKHAAQEIQHDRRRRAVELGKVADDLERDYVIFPPKQLIKDDPPPAPEPDLPARGDRYQL